MFCDAYIMCTGVQHISDIISGFVFLAACNLVEVYAGMRHICATHLPPPSLQPHPPVFLFSQIKSWSDPNHRLYFKALK